jgi:hypothetical protein
VRPITPKRYIFVSLVAIFIVIAVLGLSRIGAFAIAAIDAASNGRYFRSLGDQRGTAGILAGESDGPRKPIPRSSR